MSCSAEGTEVTIGGMINRVKKVITKNGRIAGQKMAIITLEDLEGQIDGVILAETLREVTEKYPDVDRQRADRVRQGQRSTASAKRPACWSTR